MWLQDSYSAILKMYLNKYNNIKISVDTSGKIQKIEKEENGFWKTIATHKNKLEALPVSTLILNNTNF